MKQQPLFQSVEDSFCLAERIFDRKFERCRVLVNIRPTSHVAANASVNPRIIRINPSIYHCHPQKMINVICPHEVAHIVAFDLFGRKAWNHGIWWKAVMRKMGQPPVVRHDLVCLSNYLKTVYECSGCKTQKIINNVDHRKIQNRAAFIPACRCRGSYSFVGIVADQVENKTITCLQIPENL